MTMGNEAKKESNRTVITGCETGELEMLKAKIQNNLGENFKIVSSHRRQNTK